MSSDPFKDLSRSLMKYVDAFTLDDPSEPWKSHSSAAIEVGSDEFADVWGSAPVRDAWQLGIYWRIQSGLQHLRGLAHLLVTDDTDAPRFTVARGAVEAFALAFYLAEPRIGTRERVRRYMNVKLESANAARMHMQTQVAMGSRSAEDIVGIEDEVSDIHRSAERHGMPPRRGRGNYAATYLGDTPLPTIMERCDACLAFGDGVPSGLGRIGYRTLSAVAHASEHGLDPLVGIYGPDDGRADTGDSAAVVGYKVQSALWAGMGTVTRVYAQLGIHPVGGEAARHDASSNWMRIALKVDPNRPDLPDVRS